MSLLQEFRNTAKELVERFSKDIGLSTVTHRHSAGYDADTGLLNPVEDSYDVYVAFVNIDSNERPIESHASETLKAYIAGISLTEPLKKGDRISHPTIGSFQVVAVVTDMYEALYTAYLK